MQKCALCCNRMSQTIIVTHERKSRPARKKREGFIGNLQPKLMPKIGYSIQPNKKGGRQWKRIDHKIGFR